MVVAAAMLLAACADVAGGPTPERPAGTPTSPAHGAPGSAAAPSAPAGPVPTQTQSSPAYRNGLRMGCPMPMRSAL